MGLKHLYNNQLAIKSMDYKYQMSKIVFSQLRFLEEIKIFECTALVNNYRYEDEPVVFQAKDLIQSADVIVVLTTCGNCISYSRRLKKSVLVNINREDICAIFHNQPQNSLLVVAKSSDGWAIRSYKFNDLQKCDVSAPEIVFLNLKSKLWPSSIQFDELNERMITHHKGAAKDSSCVIYDLANYMPLFIVDTTGCTSVQISKDLLVLTFKNGDEIIFRVYCITTGKLLTQLSQIIPDGRLEFTVAFNELILVKDNKKGILIINVETESRYWLSDDTIVKSRHFLVPLRHKFLISRTKGCASVWDFKGNRMSSFQDKNMLSNLFTVNQFNICLAFCLPKGSIQLINVETGEIIGNYSTIGTPLESHPATVVQFGQEKNEILTANSQGVQIWG